MPKYTRYGYVTTQVVKISDQIQSVTNVAFHLNPKLANEAIDNTVDRVEKQISGTQTIEDTTFKPNSDLAYQVTRRVLIKYLDGSTAEILLERWGVEVGRE